MPTRSFQLDPPPDLRLTLGKLNGGTSHSNEQAAGTDLWRASRTPDGPVTLHITVTGTTIEVTAWGPGAHWALHQAPDLLGAQDDPDSFPVHHRLMRELKPRFRGMRMARTEQVHAALIPVILGQVVTTKEAHRAERRLLEAYGEPAPGPRHLVLQPAPERLAGLRYEDFHPLGIARNKAQIIIEVSKRAKRLEEISQLSAQEGAKRLQSLRGIGPWTTAIVLGEVLGDADTVAVGDYHLPNTVAWALAGEARASDKRMLELLEPYRPHRRRAAMMLKLSGISAPKYGPRSPVRSFAKR